MSNVYLGVSMLFRTKKKCLFYQYHLGGVGNGEKGEEVIISLLESVINLNIEKRCFGFLDLCYILNTKNLRKFFQLLKILIY